MFAYYETVQGAIICGICASKCNEKELVKSGGFMSDEFPADRCDNRKNHSHIIMRTERGRITNAAAFTLEEKYSPRRGGSN